MNTYIYKTKKYIIAQILWDLAGVICLAFSPLLQQWLFDYGLQNPLKKIVMVILAYGELLVFYTLSQYFCALYAFKGGIKFENLLKRDFLYSLFHMESSKFYKHSIGEYVSLQGNDITALEQDYLEPVISIIRCVNMIIVYGVVLFFGVDWRIALVIILTSIFAILIPRMIGKSLTDARSTYQEQMAEYVTEITDLLEGFRVINRMTVGKILDKHEITVGVGVATLSYVSSFIEPIDTVLYNFTAIQSMKDVKKKVLAYTQDTHVTVLPRKKKLNSDITFENVTFKRKSFALQNINLTIKKGMQYAVVGHSGAGKSTLFKLIMGYEKNSSGVIRLDGEDIKNYDISELISYTDQNEHIYRAGIVDNITVFHSYPMDGIDSVGKNIWPEFFEGIFNRKEKECQRFSGGEKQAVAFLRMAAKNAEVILLDEPFSAMDAKMKSAVEHYLFTGKEFEGKTVLVITHDTREESLSQYDGIIHVGENGIYVE